MCLHLFRVISFFSRVFGVYLMVDGVLLESWMNKTHLMSCNRMMDGMVVMVGERVSAGRVASGSSASVWTFIQ